MSNATEDRVQLGRFSDVDASGEAAQLVAFIEHAERQPPIPELRQRSFDVLDLRPGQYAVDVGCGAGISVAELAGRGVRVTGVDPSEAMVTVARQRFPGLDYRVGSAEALPCPTNSVDGYRAERVYQHLKDPQPALAEAKRVLKPGARAVIIDLDADCWAVNAADRKVTRVLLHAFADTITTPWIGRQLRGLLLGSGFTNVTVDSVACVYTEYADCVHVLESIAGAGVAAGATSRDEADAWLAEQRDRSERGTFLVHGPLLMISGRRGR